jgi:hypothetical protein
MSVVILKPQLLRLKDLGEPREATRFVRRINRAFVSLPNAVPDLAHHSNF